MRTIGHFLFPETCEERWEPTIKYRALNSQVLVVATTRVEGTWKATEVNGPLENGDDIGEQLALLIFPEFIGIPYAR